ncbi:MAG: cytochrome C [Desulfobulbaceae bacterium]|nr:cytochrome C [Desulfobulbaceae bacterium]
MVNRYKYILVIGVGILIGGCNSLTVHKVTSTVFDGVPSMPSPEQYCYDYHQKALQDEREAAKKLEAQALQAGDRSVHPPYAEKRCNDCHNKESDSGFVTEKEALCAVCHKNFLEGSNVHGPAAVGSCLECHLPHNAPNPSLLKKVNGELCATCHREQRQAESLHKAVAEKSISCVKCHNPHAGNNPFFLK